MGRPNGRTELNTADIWPLGVLATQRKSTQRNQQVPMRRLCSRYSTEAPQPGLSSNLEIAEFGALFQAINKPIRLTPAAGPGIGLVFRIGILCNADRLAFARTTTPRGTEQFGDRKSVRFRQIRHFLF